MIKHLKDNLFFYIGVIVFLLTLLAEHLSLIKKFLEACLGVKPKETAGF
jgi:hypothetical protein